MPLVVSNLANLDPNQVAQCQAFVTQLLAEAHPELDLKRGVLHDVLAYFAGGILGAWNQQNLDNLRLSMSLAAINANPALADPDVVALVLSNFLVQPQPGVAATGSMTIVVSQLINTTVAANEIYTANGQQFRASQAFVGRTSAAQVVSPTDRVMTPLSDGNYAFTVDMTAVVAGSAGNILRNTAMTPATPPQNFVRAYAAADFTGGTDAQSNTQLAEQLQHGVGQKSLSGRGNMQALLAAQPGMSQAASSIVGFGDPEMLRDQHTCFPISLGGRVDWYVRTQDLPQSQTYTVTATLVSLGTSGFGTWQFSLDRTQSVGFYDVTSILQHGATGVLGGYPITSDVRQADLTDPPPLPDIVGANEAAYSAYQTAIIQFTDTDTPVAGLALGATRQYDVTVRGMPQLDTLQKAFYGGLVRNYGGDVLVKAPIPCFVSLSFSIQLRPGDTPPAVATIAQNLAQAVNRYGFTGRLPAALLADVVYNSLVGTASIGAIDMLGRIRRPDGTIRYVRASDVLVVPDEPQNMVTARTVAFYLDPGSVAIAVTTVPIPLY